MEAIYSNILEISPQEIFFRMKKDIYNSYQIKDLTNINKNYTKIRVDIINIIHKISKKMGFKSQTFFLSIYYLDIILLENKEIDINNYYLLGLSCFIVASKYCENDPDVPTLQNFLNIYNKYNSNSDEKIKIEELFETEVKILKYLNYNIHYVTIYDLDLFFFNHGIIKKQQIKDIINNNVNYNNNKNNKSDLSSNEDDKDFILDGNYIKKILEKIYKKSRYYLDLIILKYKICFKYDSLLLSIYIMKKSIEEIILNEYKLKNKDYYLNKRQIIKKTNIFFKEVMNNFYKIDYELNEKYQELIKDKNITNIFFHKEKKLEYQKKINNNIQTNFINIEKAFSNKKLNPNEIRKNNKTINDEISNFPKSKIEDNQLPNYIVSAFLLKNKKYNSNKRFNINNNKTSNSLLDFYNKNKILSTKILRNSKNSFGDNKNNSNVNINNIAITNHNSNSKSLIEKEKSTILTELKTNLKKNFSLNKKKIKDRYSHINSLKTLSKLTSYSNIINNIKEASFINNNNNLYMNEKTHSPENVLNEKKQEILNMINTEIENNNNKLFLIQNLNKVKNLKNYFSKDEIIKKHINIIFPNKNYHTNESCKNNIKNNRNGSFKIKNENNKNNESFDNKKRKKENNNIQLNYRNSIKITNEINKNNNINKPYFKKVIPNFESNNKMIKNQNNIKININKSNIYNINNNTNKINSNRQLNYISLSLLNNNNNTENPKELIKKRIISINKRNTDLENLIKNVSKNNIESEEKKKDKNDNYLYIKKGMTISEKSTNLTIPKNIKNLTLNPPIYENKSYNIKINKKNKMNQSPISLLKEIKTFNINNDNQFNNYFNKNEFRIKNASSTIETISSYHKKYIYNSLNKKKAKNLLDINIRKSNGNSLIKKNKIKNSFEANEKNNKYLNTSNIKII